MLIYEKKVDGERHLFGTKENVPAANDQQLVYKDINGATLTLAIDDGFVDGGSAGGVQRIHDQEQDVNVSVYVNGIEKPIIGDVLTMKKAAVKPVEVKPEVKPVEIKKAEVKVEEKVEEIKKVEEKAKEDK